MPPLLQVDDLRATVEGKEILSGLSLTIDRGEVHAIMGPNGSGKSTLASVLMGHPAYKVTGGKVKFWEKDLLALNPEERSKLGLFLAWQYPVAVPGLSVEQFLRTALNAHREHRGEKSLNPAEFRQTIEPKLETLKFKAEFLERSLNDGFSGGEKKRLEILQLAVLEPTLAILDETDSGLDVDAMKLVAEGVNQLIGPRMAVLVITHYQRLLHYLKPSHVHILTGGRIVKSGSLELIATVEQAGYKQFETVHVI